LMLPASNLEKYLTALLYIASFFTACVLLSFALGDTLRMVFRSLVFGDEWVSTVPIVAKNLMYHYMISAARRVKSEALKAEAWHHRTDSLSSIGGLVGMAGAQFGAPILDSIACVVICVFIVRTACQIFVEAVGKLIDEACDEETELAMRDAALRQEGVTDIQRLRTRKFGSGMCADIKVTVEADMPLSKACDICASVQSALMQEFCALKDCTVAVASGEKDK
ncbi:MAG: cation diffusion facilitator family transporter, partial [Clostridia bacterium]|nr:cation diffusion facilitator family transporter [Clostridia bacterium]